MSYCKWVNSFCVQNLESRPSVVLSWVSKGVNVSLSATPDEARELIAALSECVATMPVPEVES